MNQVTMMCSVKGCNSRNSVLDGVSFHCFPSHEPLKHQWMIALGQPDSNFSQQERICSKHFEAHFLKHSNGKTMLQCGAVPTLHVQGARYNPTAKMNDAKPNLNTNKKTVKHTRNLDEDIEDTDNEISETEKIDEEDLDMECYLSEKEDAETNIEPSNDTTMKHDYQLPPKIRKLIFTLQKKALVAESQKKTVKRLRSKLYHLRKKNKELEALIEIMKSESVKGHKGPSILLVGV